jgi:hypothetical protein
LERLTFFLNVQNSILTNGATWDIIVSIKTSCQCSFFNDISITVPEARIHLIAHLALTGKGAMIITNLALFILIIFSVSTKFGAWLVNGSDSFSPIIFRISLISLHTMA